MDFFKETFRLIDKKIKCKIKKKDGSKIKKGSIIAVIEGNIKVRLERLKLNTENH